MILAGVGINSLAFGQVLPVPEFDTAYFKSGNSTYPIPYRLINATLIGTTIDLPAKTLVFKINAISDGQLTVELPRAIIDSKNGSQDKSYRVTTDNIQSLGGPMRVVPEELSVKDVRVLQINFSQGTSDIEISGTYFVENYSFIPQKLVSPLKQFKSGMSANNVTCNQGLELIFKAEDGSPTCVKSETAQKLIERGWAIAVNSSDNSLTKTLYAGIDKPSGIILLGNQTYYMTTFNNTLDSIPSSGDDILFHGVLFTLLRPPESTANGLLYVVDVKFTSDKTNESLVIYPVGVGAVQADKVLSKHTHPQVGFIVYRENTIKLLVSTENQTLLSSLHLSLSTNSTTIQSGQSIWIDISLNNTSSEPLTLATQDHWPINGIGLGGCSFLPVGIAIADGHYTENNMTDAKPLSLYFLPPCPPGMPEIKSFTFQPMSNQITVECKPTNFLAPCPSMMEVRDNVAYSSFWKINIFLASIQVSIP